MTNSGFLVFLDFRKLDTRAKTCTFFASVYKLINIIFSDVSPVPHTEPKFLTDDDSYFNNPEVFGECDPETKDIVYQLWEDFAHVATKLLDRIEENTSSLPVVSPS